LNSTGRASSGSGVLCLVGINHKIITAFRRTLGVKAVPCISFKKYGILLFKHRKKNVLKKIR